MDVISGTDWLLYTLTRKNEISWLSLSDISRTACYCDEGMFGWNIITISTAHLASSARVLSSAAWGPECGDFFNTFHCHVLVWNIHHVFRHYCVEFVLRINRWCGWMDLLSIIPWMTFLVPFLCDVSGHVTLLSLPCTHLHAWIVTCIKGWWTFPVFKICDQLYEARLKIFFEHLKLQKDELLCWGICDIVD